MARIFAVIQSLILINCSLAPAGDWTGFRGPTVGGETANADPPVRWDESDPPGWAVDLPGRGFSQPVVAGDRIFTTCSSGFSKDRLHVVCHDLQSGRELWHRQYWASGRTSVPETMRVATPTPVVADGRVYCLFSSGDLACLDFQGDLLWYRGLGYDYPQATNSLGMSSSPLIVDGVLICQLEADSEAFTIGLDAETGKNLWKIDRLHKANWTSPIPYVQGNTTSVLLEGGDGVEAIHPRTGETLWQFECGASTVSSMTLVGDILLVPANGLTALRLGDVKDVPQQIWNNKKLSCSFVSPVVVNQNVYTINSAGVLRCADIATGELRWQARVHGEVWGTPSAAAGRLYCPTREGTLVIVDLVGEPGEILAEQTIGEGLFSPPVLVKNSILLRTDSKLIRITQP